MAIEKLKSFNKGEGYPSDDTSVEDKNNSPAYSLEWMEYIYGCYHNDKTAITSDKQIHFGNLRRYAEGKQDWVQYMKQFTGEASSTTPARTTSVSDLSELNEGSQYINQAKQARTHAMNVDWTKIFSPAPKFMRAITGMFLQANHDIIVDALDRQSTTERLEKKWRMWVDSQTKEVFDTINQKMGIPTEDKGPLPQTKQELELYASLSNAKLAYEIAAEEAAIHTEEFSDINDIKVKVITDAATLNCCFMSDEIDRDTYKVKGVYVDPETLIIEYDKNNDYSNTRFAAYPTFITGWELKQIAPNKNPDELKKLCLSFQGMYGNPIAVDGKNLNYYDFRIPVLKGMWRTIDQPIKKIEVEVNKSKVRKKELETGKIKQVEDRYYKLINKVVKTIPAVYEAKWVMGSDIVYDYGRIGEDTGRLPIHGYIFPGTSIIEQMIPLLDNIQYTFLKLQTAIIKSPPPGLAIDISGIKGFVLGNSKFDPLDLIRIYSQSGTMLYNSNVKKGSLQDDKVNSRKFIEQLPGGMGTVITESVTAFELNFNLMAEITGISRESFVGNVNPNQTATQTKAMVAGTNNVLQPIYDGWIKTRKSFLNSAIPRIQIICMNQNAIPEGKGYEPVIGIAGVQALAVFGKQHPMAFGIKITPAPTEEEKMEIRRQIMDAQSKGMISPDIATFVTIDLIRGNSLNKITAYLSYVLEKGRQLQAKIAEENQLRDRETQVVVAKSKAESEAQLEDVKHKNKMAEIQLEKDLELRNLQAQPKSMSNVN